MTSEKDHGECWLCKRKGREGRRERQIECVIPLTDLEFVKTFLYTYQSFSTPEKLLKKLIERYNVVRPEGMPLKTFSVMKQTIQARVINAFKLWVDLSADFKGTLVCV